MVNKMKSEDFKYKPLEEDELKILWKKHKQIIEAFIEYNHYDNEKVFIDETAVMAIIAKVHQRGKYFEYFHGLNMSECKEVALTSFWIIKLRPICAVSKEVNCEDIKVFNAINEKLALYYIIITLQGMLETEQLPIKQLNELPQKYIREIVYSFRYRDISKEALILLVESMAVFLGLDPYNKKKKEESIE